MRVFLESIAQGGENVLLSRLFAIKARHVLRITLFMIIVAPSEINVWKAETDKTTGWSVPSNNL